MIFPAFLRPGDTVGITAPSAGVDPADTEFDFSLSVLRAAGYRIRESADVRTGLPAGAPPQTRGRELNGLLRDDTVKAILCAAGGDFLIGMLPFADPEAFRANPKWIKGYSDPTGLLYYFTTKTDIATIYGLNAGGYAIDDPSVAFDLALLGGAVLPQKSYALYEGDRALRAGDRYALTEPVVWETPCGPVDARGRLLGGCLDCLCDLFGTRFDGTEEFLSRYAGEGVIWYFDIFDMRAEAVYRALFKMREMGYFYGAKAFLFGRVCFPGSYAEISYPEAARMALGDAPMVFGADVGHVPPRMTLINGAMAHLTAADGRGQLEMSLS